MRWMPGISMMGVRALSFSISGSERRSKIVWMFKDLRVRIPAGVTCEGSALRKRRSERVVVVVVVVGGGGCGLVRLSVGGLAVVVVIEGRGGVVVAAEVGEVMEVRYPPMERKL